MTLCWTRHDGDTSMTTPSITNHKGSGNTTFLARFDFYLVFIVYSVFYIPSIRVFFLNNTLKFIIRYTLKAYPFLVGACVQNKCPLQRARYASDCLKRSSKIGNEVVFLFSLALCSLKVLHVLLIILTFHNWITTVIWYTLMYIYMCFLK